MTHIFGRGDSKPEKGAEHALMSCCGSNSANLFCETVGNHILYSTVICVLKSVVSLVQPTH
jgi:hypothetical protein